MASLLAGVGQLSQLAKLCVLVGQVVWTGRRRVLCGRWRGSTAAVTARRRRQWTVTSWTLWSAPPPRRWTDDLCATDDDLRRPTLPPLPRGTPSNGRNVSFVRSATRPIN